MTDTTSPNLDDATELTVQDILDEANAAPYHTILEVWREVLKPAETERTKRITPQWANRICTNYRELRFEDMPDFRDRYFGKVLELAGIVEAEISTDDECLNFTTPEEDAEFNTHHYLNIISDWQKALLTWELDWDCTHPDAAIEVAAISETHRMFFDNTGLASLLDNIPFQYTEADQANLAAALEELRAERED